MPNWQPGPGARWYRGEERPAPEPVDPPIIVTFSGGRTLKLRRYPWWRRLWLALRGGR